MPRAGKMWCTPEFDDDHVSKMEDILAMYE
jgi:hypothetical protein